MPSRILPGMVILLTGLAAGVLVPTTASWAEPKVVVTSKPIHSLVAGVMAGVGTPRLLVDGNASPHTYALKPSDAKALNAADVVFRVSEALEPFTSKVFKSLPKKVRAVSLAEAPGLDLLQRREGGAFESHAHGHGHAHRGHRHTHASGKEARESSDPHVWLDPRNASRMVEHAAAVLAEVVPAAADRFRGNAAAITARLAALDRELEAQLKPLAGRPFVVFHDSLQYLEARYGLTAVGSITVSPDQQPSARRLTDLRRKIAGLDAVCVLAEPQFPGKLVDSLTEGTRARRAVADPEAGLLQAGPELYFQLMRGVAAALKDCLAAN